MNTIHQTWKDSQTTHWIFAKSRKSIDTHLPAWQHRLWTDQDLEFLVRQHYPHYHPRWLALNKPIKRVDIARCLILHLHGGIYADLDFIFTRDPEPLFQDGSDLYFYQSTEAIVKGWDYLGNAFMAAKPGNPFWLRLVDHMLAMPADTPVLMHTGPLAIGAFYRTLTEKPRMTIFGPDIFDNDRCDAGVGAHAYGYHMRMASWQRPQGLPV